MEPNAKILVADLSPVKMEQVPQLIKRHLWAGMETAILDVRNLSGLEDNTFTHVITNIGMLIPGDRDTIVNVLREVFRVLKLEGVAAVFENWTIHVKFETRSLFSLC